MQHEELSPRRPAFASHAILFLAALLLATTGLHRVLPNSGGNLTEAKLEAFARAIDRYEVVFLGSSRVYRGFDPKIFDAEAAASGHPMRSFNLGLFGYRVPECLELLEELARRRPSRLRYVMIDPEPLEMILRREALTRREVDWHEAGLTLDTARFVWNAELDVGERLSLLRHHSVAFLHNAFNLGRGEQVARSVAGQPPFEDENDVIGPNDDGYRPVSGNLVELAATGDRGAAADLRFYRKKVDALMRAPRERSDLPARSLVFYERIRDACSRLGAEPIFVVQPSIMRRSDLRRAYAYGHVAILFDYGDPGRYPELYAPELRSDLAHLNSAGASIFTALLARDFLDLLESRGRGAR